MRIPTLRTVRPGLPTITLSGKERDDIDVFPKCTIWCDVSMFSMISNDSLTVSMNRSETTGQQFDNGQFYSKRQVGFFAIIASSVNVRAFPAFSALSARVVGKSTSKLQVSLDLDTCMLDLREQLYWFVVCGLGW